MANGNTSPSRVGQVNSAGDVDALFLKKFSGEILQTFEESNIFKPLHTVRTIENGKSAQFPVTGIASADYHTPGENIADAGNSYLSDIKKAEQTITIDKMLLASTFLSNIDDVKNHYDIRSVYANELGKALALRFDTAIAKTFIAAARSSAVITGGKTGGQLDVANNDFSAGNTPGTPAAVTGAELITALFTAAQKLDENDIPGDGRFAVLRPSEYYKLITGGSGAVAINTSAANKDVGGSGSLASGSIAQVAGINIFKSTHIPSTDLSAVSTGDGASSNDLFGASGVGYNGDFRNSMGIVGHSAAVGTVKLLDLGNNNIFKISSIAVNETINEKVFSIYSLKSFII